VTDPNNALDEPDNPFLPPLSAWSGASERHLAAADDPWITRAESSDFRDTADAVETWEWLRRLEDACDDMAIRTIGQSAGRREIDMVIASRFGFDPHAVRASAKAIVLVQACIHAGEVDGKDAMLLLLRDLAVGRRSHILDEAVVLFVPIVNVDGYAHFGPHRRINQRGPHEVGLHTNDQNLNLNRDFAKLDAPESRAIVDLINAWNPDLFIDTHVTDGADYRYDVTFGSTTGACRSTDARGSTAGASCWSPTIAAWLDAELLPVGHAALEAEGHEPGPLTLAVNDRDMSAGRFDFRANARFATGYASLRHLPAILIENHSLKPFRRRVLGLYVLLAALIAETAKQVTALRAAVRADRARRPDRIPLGWTVSTGDGTPAAPFKGIRSTLKTFVVSGEPIPQWTGEADDTPVALVPMSTPSASVRRPLAYFVPAHLIDIVMRLEHHGIQVEELNAPQVFHVQLTRLPEARVIGSRHETGIVGTAAAEVSEGRVRVTPGPVHRESLSMTLRKGTFRVALDQPLGDLAAVLLEVESPDSFFQWGFMLSMLEDTAHGEPYVLEPLGDQLLRDRPDLKAAFDAALARDAAFAANPEARRRWILARTPYADPRYRVYPILSEEP
jgi:murein tripeptide amidase MpaA